MKVNEAKGLFVGFLLGLAAAGPSCGLLYGPEAKCHSIALGTSISELPALPPGTFTMTGSAYVGPADELGCCLKRSRALDAGLPPGACTVDCGAYDGLVELRLGPPYDGRCAELPGTMLCNVLVQDGRVVAVNGRCEE